MSDTNEAGTILGANTSAPPAIDPLALCRDWVCGATTHDRTVLLPNARAIAGFTGTPTAPLVRLVYLPQGTRFEGEGVVIGHYANSTTHPGAIVALAANCLGLFVTLFDASKGSPDRVPPECIGGAFPASDARADTIVPSLPSGLTGASTLHLVVCSVTLPRGAGAPELEGRLLPADADALGEEGPYCRHWLECHAPSRVGYVPWSAPFQEAVVDNWELVEELLPPLLSGTPSSTLTTPMLSFIPAPTVPGSAAFSRYTSAADRLSAAVANLRTTPPPPRASPPPAQQPHPSTKPAAAKPDTSMRAVAVFCLLFGLQVDLTSVGTPSFAASICPVRREFVEAITNYTGSSRLHAASNHILKSQRAYGSSRDAFLRAAHPQADVAIRQIVTQAIACLLDTGDAASTGKALSLFNFLPDSARELAQRKKEKEQNDTRAMQVALGETDTNTTKASVKNVVRARFDTPEEAVAAFALLSATAHAVVVFDPQAASFDAGPVVHSVGGRVWEVLTSENGQTRLGAVKQPLVLAYEGWTVVLQTFRHLAKLLQDESLIGVVVELLTTGHLIADDDAADPKPVALGSSATETVAEMCAEVVEHLTALSKSFSRTAKDPTPGAEFAKSGHPEDPTKARAEEQKRTKDLRTEIDRLKKELVEARKVAKSPRTPGGPPGTPGGNKTGCFLYPKGDRMPMPLQGDYPMDASGQRYPELCVQHHREGLQCLHPSCRRDHTAHTQWPAPLKTFICAHVDATANLTWNKEIVTPDWLGLSSSGGDASGSPALPHPSGPAPVRRLSLSSGPTAPRLNGAALTGALTRYVPSSATLPHRPAPRLSSSRQAPMLTVALSASRLPPSCARTLAPPRKGMSLIFDATGMTRPTIRARPPRPVPDWVSYPLPTMIHGLGQLLLSGFLEPSVTRAVVDIRRPGARVVYDPRARRGDRRGTGYAVYTDNFAARWTRLADLDDMFALVRTLGLHAGIAYSSD